MTGRLVNTTHREEPLGSYNSLLGSAEADAIMLPAAQTLRPTYFSAARNKPIG